MSTMRPPLIRTASGSWTIVVLGFFALSLSFSARSVVQIALPYWEEEFGWTRSLSSMGGATALRYDGVWLISVGLAIFAGLICFTIGETRRGRLVPAPA